MHKSLMELSEEEFVNEVNKAFVSQEESLNGIESFLEDIGRVQTKGRRFSYGTFAILLATSDPR